MRLPLCPRCRRHSLAEHCKSNSCTWHTCRNAECRLLVDLRRRRGLIPIPGEEQGYQAVVLPAAETG